MKKIAVVTATRAEYGLLSPVIKELRKFESSELTVELIVTGTHLSKKYGNTIQEIVSDGLRIDHKIEIKTDSATEMDISKNQADTLLKFTELFVSESYNAVILLGDRYELLAVAIAAGNAHIPIFHMCGGDTTEGAMDEWIRHSVTKMSYLHFVTNEKSRERVIQLGEDPQRVFNYGSTSIDNILQAATMSRKEALDSVGLMECTYAVCTYHPVTMESGSVDEAIYDFLEAIRTFPDIEFIITKSNADKGGARINEILDKEEKAIPNIHVFTSLGIKRYLSLMRYSAFVLGNSSSGIIEAPSFHIPTVNIGDRQKGRIQAISIINCQPDTASIIEAVNLALGEDMKRKCSEVVSPYGDGNAAQRIASKSIEVVKSNIDLKKQFYDMQLSDKK